MLLSHDSWCIKTCLSSLLNVHFLIPQGFGAQVVVVVVVHDSRCVLQTVYQHHMCGMFCSSQPAVESSCCSFAPNNGQGVNSVHSLQHRCRQCPLPANNCTHRMNSVPRLHLKMSFLTLFCVLHLRRQYVIDASTTLKSLQNQ